jgi:DNA polymerase (family X)
MVAVDPHLGGGDRTIEQGDQLVVHVTAPERFGIALLFATGSDAHLKALRAQARRKGLSLDAEGLSKKGGIVAGRTEEEIYAALGLPLIAPELRESGREVGLALAGQLPELVTQADLRGVLHAHTTESDGSDSLEDMAEASCRRGYAYLGLTDHSQTAHYAGGLKVEEVAAQQRAVERLNKRYGAKFHVFKGIESDILGNGTLDLSGQGNGELRPGRRQRPQQVPHGPPGADGQNRQGRREPAHHHPGPCHRSAAPAAACYDVDMERIQCACARHGVAVEINAHPWRLDMDWRWCERALELGCLFSINPDAHSTEEIDNVRWGVLMARKGAVLRERVLNALTLPEFGAFLKRRKS